MRTPALVIRARRWYVVLENAVFSLLLPITVIVLYCAHHYSLQVVGAHLDDELQPYYTIQLPDGREKQTDDAHLAPLSALPKQQVIPPPPPPVSPDSPLQPKAPMPKSPPPPVQKQQEGLPEPQDEPWDMTGRDNPKKKPQPPKPEDGRRRSSSNNNIAKSKNASDDYPFDEKPKKAYRQHHGKTSSQSNETMRRAQRHRQQQRRYHVSQFDPYARQQYHQQQRDPWRSQHDPLGPFFGGGMPIRSRL